jgi:hypothetical protein
MTARGCSFGLEGGKFEADRDLCGGTELAVYETYEICSEDEARTDRRYRVPLCAETAAYAPFGTPPNITFRPARHSS